MKLILIAPSGGGKGSLADLIVQDYNIPNISTGDILREHRKKGTELGKIAQEYIDKGLLVPDEVMINIIKERVKAEDCKNGYILDGFPRTLGQAKALSAAGIKVDSVVELDVADDMIIERLAGRWTCKNNSCGHITNERFADYKAGECSKCSGEIYQRDDDKPEAIKQRIANYHNNSRAILDYYSEEGLLYSIKIAREDMPTDTFEKVKKYLVEKGIK